MPFLECFASETEKSDFFFIIHHIIKVRKSWFKIDLVIFEKVWILGFEEFYILKKIVPAADWNDPDYISNFWSMFLRSINTIISICLT